MYPVNPIQARAIQEHSSLNCAASWKRIFVTTIYIYYLYYYMCSCRKKSVRSDAQNFALNHLHKRFRTSVHFRILSDILIRFILSPRDLCPSEMTTASCYLARERPSVVLMLKLCITKNWSFKRAPRPSSWSLSSGRII